MIDCHLHLQDAVFSKSLPEIIATIRSLGITRLVVNGCHPGDWAEVERLALLYPEVMPSFGLHPWWTDEAATRHLVELERYLQRNPNAGIGEIGLDGVRQGKGFDVQRSLFRAQLDIAVALDRPISIHCVKAWGSLLDCLADIPSPRAFLLHSYSGSKEMSKEFLKTGAYFSISGAFFRTGWERKLAVFDSIPNDRLLIETDAPNMALPQEIQRFALAESDGNHPGNLVGIYEQVASNRGLSLEALTALIRTNFSRCFLQFRK